jgi:DNA invertase Pin-like site-specific DNA recombinase
MRVAIYARVSTEDKGQDPENQLRQLRAWCASAGHQVIREYADHASGGKGTEKRLEFAAMLCEAHKRQFDLVLCWALDRLSREGIKAGPVRCHSGCQPSLSSGNLPRIAWERARWWRAGARPDRKRLW